MSFAPIRCFTCGKIMGNRYDTFNDFLKEGFSPQEAIKKLDLTRYCCKRMVQSYVDLDERISQDLEIPSSAGKSSAR
jgi:DNA-directed RNA polymerases I, II, and III subunit RPABC5